MISHFQDHSHIFQCPCCGGELANKNASSNIQISCLQCSVEFDIVDGIPELISDQTQQHQITSDIRNFYEKTPFPDYEAFETTGDLVAKARAGVFARLLDEQIPLNTQVLEVGCGTGQLSNFLGLAHRYVFGVDLCRASLKLGFDFAQVYDIDRVGFYRTDLFHLPFKAESFPVVICNGVLHHTYDALEGFKAIAKLVQSGGYVIVGLYNRYGRWVTDIRRKIFGLSGDQLKFIDPRLRKLDRGQKKRQAWFLDQYKNPHETKHTIGEVLRWFHECGFEFVNSLPHSTALSPIKSDEALFEKHPQGTIFDHMLVQTAMVMKGSAEGGFFVMIGKKI